MAFVETFTNLSIPGIEEVMKQLISDSTGRQETTIFSVVHKLDAFKFGAFSEGMYVRVGYIGPEDVYRTRKVLEYITNALYYRHGVSKQQVYVEFIHFERPDVCIGSKTV